MFISGVENYYRGYPFWINQTSLSFRGRDYLSFNVKFASFVHFSWENQLFSLYFTLKSAKFLVTDNAKGLVLALIVV
jgi:hypothetical protein